MVGQIAAQPRVVIVGVRQRCEAQIQQALAVLGGQAQPVGESVDIAVQQGRQTQQWVNWRAGRDKAVQGGWVSSLRDHRGEDVQCRHQLDGGARVGCGKDALQFAPHPLGGQLREAGDAGS